MTFNLSGPFLAQFGIDQLHSEGALLVQVKRIPMVALLNPSADVEQTVSNLYVIEKVTVPAFSETKFVVRASAVEGGTMSSGDGIATGSIPFLNVVTKCDKDGRVRVGVMNTTMEAIVIPVGTKYGNFSRIVDASNPLNIHSALQSSTVLTDPIHLAEKRLANWTKERRLLPRRRLPRRPSQLTRLTQSWHPGWLGPLRQRTLRPVSTT
jgi:hypothetical protein